MVYNSASGARVVKWYTRTLEVRMPQGVEVQVLSRAHPYQQGASLLSAVDGRLAQLVRAPRLHRGCRGFESLSVHS